MKAKQLNQAHPSYGYPAAYAGAGRPGGHILNRIGEDVAALFDMIDLWRQRASDRMMLASMDDRSLQDIGCSRIDADTESTKPFWRA